MLSNYYSEDTNMRDFDLWVAGTGKNSTDSGMKVQKAGKGGPFACEITIAKAKTLFINYFVIN